MVSSLFAIIYPNQQHKVVNCKQDVNTTNGCHVNIMTVMVPSFIKLDMSSKGSLYMNGVQVTQLGEMSIFQIYAVLGESRIDPP